MRGGEWVRLRRRGEVEGERKRGRRVFIFWFAWLFCFGVSDLYGEIEGVDGRMQVFFKHFPYEQ